LGLRRALTRHLLDLAEEQLRGRDGLAVTRERLHDERAALAVAIEARARAVGLAPLDAHDLHQPRAERAAAEHVVPHERVEEPRIVVADAELRELDMGLGLAGF